MDHTGRKDIGIIVTMVVSLSFNNPTNIYGRDRFVGDMAIMAMVAVDREFISGGCHGDGGISGGAGQWIQCYVMAWKL